MSITFLGYFHGCANVANFRKCGRDRRRVLRAGVEARERTGGGMGTKRGKNKQMVPLSPEDFAKEMELALASERAEEKRRDEELRAACASGDQESIDRLLRLDASDDDALGHQVSLDQIAEKRAAQMK